MGLIFFYPLPFVTFFIFLLWRRLIIVPFIPLIFFFGGVIPP